MGLSAKTGTLALTGSNIAITGLGFQPKVVLFWTMGANVSSSDNVTQADTIKNFGAADGTNQFCCSFYEHNGGTGGTNSYVAASSAFCIMGNGSGNSTAFDGASCYSLASLDSDGFTINVSSGGTPAHGAIRVQYLALAGSDISNVIVGSQSVSTHSGSKSYTGLGFQPDALIVAIGASDNSRTTSYIGPFLASLGVGFFDGTNQAVCAGLNSGVGSNNQTRHYGKSGEFICSEAEGSGDSNPVLQLSGTATSLDSDGFTINFTVNGSSVAPLMGYVAMKGPKFKVGSFLTETDTTTHMTQTGFGFSPSAALLLSANDAQSTAGTLQTGGSSLALGAFDSATSRNASAGNAKDASSPTVCSAAVEFDQVYVNVSPTSATVIGAMDLISVDSDGFTSIMTAADPQQNFAAYLAFGPAGGGGGGGGSSRRRIACVMQ